MSGARPPRGGIALVGYRGTGKSTVGRIVAGRLGRPFADADAALEARFGRPIREIFQDLGEPVFRDWEEQVLADLTGDRGLVLATGGGAVLRGPNRKALRAFGFVVWLSAPPGLLAARLGANPAALAGRPALTSVGTLDEIAAVLAAREPLYREAADAEVRTEGKSPYQVADAVIAALPRADAGRDPR